jgi:hypothetical protein
MSPDALNESFTAFGQAGRSAVQVMNDPFTSLGVMNESFMTSGAPLASGHGHGSRTLPARNCRTSAVT